MEKWIKLRDTDTSSSRAELIARIESIASIVIQDICDDRFPKLSPPEPSSNTMQHGKERNPPQKSINFGSKTSRNRFALMMTVLSTAHQLLITNKTLNRRAFYYKLKTEKAMHLVRSQQDVDRAVNSVANLLNCPPWKLHLVPTCTSLVAGDITFYVCNNVIVDCSTAGDCLIPQMASDVRSIRAKAKFVLVIEKDTVFQLLLKANCTGILNCILITGKGYPSVNARMLVKKLWEEMDLPIYILVDSDPFGIDIMLVYRYGSLTLSKENDSLACRKARWLGIFPSELEVLGAKTLPLSKHDVSKLRSIESRLAEHGEWFVNEKIFRELNAIRQGKSEIESLISCFTQEFFVKSYLRCKIEAGDFI